MAFGEGRSVFVVAETTAGVDPEADPETEMTAVPVEDSEPGDEAVLRELPQVGAVGDGRADSVLRVDYSYRGRIPIFPVTIADGNSRSISNLLLRACGIGAPTYAAGPPKTLTSNRQTIANPLTLTLYEYLINDDGEAIQTLLHGLRGSGVLSWGPDTDLALAFELIGMSGSKVDEASPPTATYADTEGDVRPAYTGLAAAISVLKELGASTVYEGCMTSGEIDFGMDTARLNGIPVGAGGACPTRSNPRRSTFRFNIEKQKFASWDPYTYRDAATPIQIEGLFTAGDSALDTLKIQAYGQITSVSRGFEDGFGVWQIEGKCLWLPVSPSTVPGLTENTTLRLIEATAAA